MRSKLAKPSSSRSNGFFANSGKKSSNGIQAKLKANKPGDQYEVEADKTADHVVGQSMGSVLSSKSTSPGADFGKPLPVTLRPNVSSSAQRKEEEEVQTKEAENESEELDVQMKESEIATMGISVEENVLLKHELANTKQQEDDGERKIDDQNEPYKKKEFEIYTELKLEVLNQQIDQLINNIDGFGGAEKELKKMKNNLNDLISERNDFVTKKDKFIRDRNKNEKNGKVFFPWNWGWSSTKYEEKVISKFGDYKAVLLKKKQSIHKQVSKDIENTNSRINNALSSLQNAIEHVSFNIGSAKKHIGVAEDQLQLAIERKQNADSALDRYPENQRNGEKGILFQYDTILNSYKKLIEQLKVNIVLIQYNKSKFENFSKNLTNQQLKLTNLGSHIAKEKSIVELVELQKEFQELKKSIDQSILNIDISPVNQPIDKAVIVGEMDSLLDQINALELELEKTLSDAKLAQATTKNVSSLTEHQIRILTATSLAEGSGHDMREIVWIYVNSIRRSGFELAMRKSSAYDIRGYKNSKISYRKEIANQLILPPPHNTHFKGWMLALGGGSEYEEGASGKKNKIVEAQERLKYVREEVLGDLTSNPFPEFYQQGYWGDLNTGPDDYYRYARQFLAKWFEHKKTPIKGLKGSFGDHMQIIGSGKNLTFLWDAHGVEKFIMTNNLMTNDEGNAIGLRDVPFIKVSTGWILKINGNEIKPTR